MSRSWLCAPRLSLGLLVSLGLSSGAACKVDTDPNMTGGDSFAGDTSDASDLSSDEGSDCPDDGCLDLVPDEGEIPCEEEGGGCECEAPEHVPCDEGQPDLLRAIGLNCEGEAQYEVGSWGSGEAFGTLTEFGPTDAFAPREGSRYAVIGSGRVVDLPQVEGDDPDVYDLCNSDLGAFDVGIDLPAPLLAQDVGAVTCTEDESLIGTGDCSNTLQKQFNPPGSVMTVTANDYTELRFTATVPPATTSFSYDFAFMSFEYPDFWQSQYNDMYIGWLESETWTGNISFDANGAPITVNAGFMDYLDADSEATDPDTFESTPHPDCPPGTNCMAPEIQGTCMQGHGATRWLTTTATVNPGDEITIVFAVMDLGDSVLDSYVFIDNFQWGCEGGDPPSTIPID